MRSRFETASSITSLISFTQFLDTIMEKDVLMKIVFKGLHPHATLPLTLSSCPQVKTTRINPVTRKQEPYMNLSEKICRLVSVWTLIIIMVSLVRLC